MLLGVCPFFFSGKPGLTLGDSSYRATTCTSAAADAHILIDNELSAIIGNRTYRAGSCACTASDASITNYICHGSIPPSEMM